MQSNSRSRSPRRRRLLALPIALLGLAALGVAPAVAVINDPPGAPVTIAVGVNTSFVAAEGLPAVPHTVEVWRAGTKIASSAPITPAAGVIEINHLLEPDCWDSVTPDIRPGDQIRVMTSATDGNQTTARDIRVDPPVRTGPTQIQLHGLAAEPDGVTPLPIEELGGLVRNTAVTIGNNGGGVRWLIPGEGTIAYDATNNPNDTKFTITINFLNNKGIGGAQAEADAAMAADVVEAEWARPVVPNELHFADANGVPGPNGDPCLEPLQQGPTNVRLTAATDSGSSNTDGITNITAPSITGTVSIPPTGLATKAVNLYLDGAPVGGTPTATTTIGVGAAGVFTIPIPGPLVPGTHSVVVSEVDGPIGPLGTVETTARNAYTFTVDTSIPAAPTGLAVVPAGPANNNTPFVTGTSPEAGSTVSIHTDSACVTPSLATGTAAEFASPGIQVTVPNDTTTTFYAAAADAAGNGPSACSAAGATYVEDSTPPGTPVITSAPAVTDQTTATVTFTTPAPAPDFVDCSLVIGAPPNFAPCLSPFTQNGLADGAYTFTVRVRDQAGNAASVAVDFTVDATAPAPPSFNGTNPLSPSSANTLRVLGTAEALSTVRMYTDATCTSASPVIGTAAAFASPGLSVTVPANSTTTFYATATDAVGNVSPCSPAGIAYEEDSLPPAAPTITAAPPALTKDPAPLFAFTGDPGVTFQCSFSTGGDAFSACTSPRSYPGSGDGNYTFRVRAADAAGNTSTATSATVTIDATPPAAPTITAPLPPLITNDTTPTFTFTGEPGVTFQCSVLGALVPCTSPFTPTVAVEGTHTFSVQAVDAALNASPSATRSITIDTTAPGGPVLVSPPPLVANDTTPTFGFTGEPGATFGCSMTGGAPFAACTSPFTSAVLVSGDHTFAVRQTDQAGNTGVVTTRTYSLDLTAPAAPTFGPAPASPSNSNTPFVTGAAEANSAVTLYATANCTEASIGTGTAATFATPGVTATVPTDAVTVIRATATDAAGNVSACSPTSVSYAEDSTPPTAAAILSGPPPIGTSRDVAFTFQSVTLIPGLETLTCSLSTGADAFGACTTPTTFTQTGLADGTYTFKTKVNDGFGNDAISTRQFTIDNVAPTATILSGPGDATTDATPTFNFSASELGATFECGIGQTGTPTFAPCASLFTVGPLALGDWVFTVRAKDAAGNVGVPATAGFRVQAEAVAPPPPPPPPVIGAPTVTTRRVVARTNRVVLQIRCTGPAGATCSGTVDINRVIAATATRRSRTIRYGRTNATILAGQTVRVTVVLNSSARAALKATKRLTLKTVVTPTGAKPSSFPLTVTLPAPPR